VFDYKGTKHELVYSDYCPTSRGRGLLTLIQHRPTNQEVLEELIGSIESIAVKSTGFMVSRQTSNDYKNNSVKIISTTVDFYPERFSNPDKKVEQFFNKNEIHLLGNLNFTGKVTIRAEYHDVSEWARSAYSGD